MSTCLKITLGAVLLGGALALAVRPPIYSSHPEDAAEHASPATGSLATR